MREQGIALKLGAEKAIGIDIDPQALLASKDNAGRNDIADKLDVFLPQDQPDMQADIVLANILAAPLRELRGVITNYCKSGGLLVMSGILATQAEEINELYAADFDMDPIAIEGDWARVSGKKR